MATSSSQNITSSDELRAVMPVDLFRAAIKGHSDLLIPRLQLLQPRDEQFELNLKREKEEAKWRLEQKCREEEQEQKQDEDEEEDENEDEEEEEKEEADKVVITAPGQIHIENQTVQSELQSTTHFGDTILHLLVSEGHNELALKVFQRDFSLLKAQNNMLETPLYCAAKVGNEEVIHKLIESNGAIVGEYLEKTNKNGDTALHVAAQHGHINVGSELMKLNPKEAYKVNKKIRSPLYIATVNGYTKMVQTMLEVDSALAYTQFADRMFPVQLAARMDNNELVRHFMEKYPDDAELRNPHGRNLFHIAAEENIEKVFLGVFKDTGFRAMIERMNTAKDYEGNTPLHIAAMKGHKLIMRAIWENKMNSCAEKIPNNEGLTPLKLSVRQLLETNKNIDDGVIRKYVETEGNKFTRKWLFGVMEPPSDNIWERTQLIGLGSVLITTVTFAAAFTISGGYNEDDGTPILGRKYMFRAFIIANALAFIQGFLSLLVLLYGTVIGQFVEAILFATSSFLYAASSMVVAFGLGMYVMLAPVFLPVAIIQLVITLFLGSPAVIAIVSDKKFLLISFVSSLSSPGLGFLIVAFYAVTFLLIFCLALL